MTAYDESMAALVRRIEELEDKFNTEVTSELVRHDRWYATRDAALQGILASPDTRLDARLEAAPILRATQDYADRAHGPLVPK